MPTEDQWWPDTPWRMEGFRANPELRDCFVGLHEELNQILTDANQQGETLVQVDIRVLSRVYYALLAQIQMSNQSILLEIQDLRNEILDQKK